MKDEKYKVKCFRLNEETIRNLAELKGDQSWNMFFWKIIKMLKTKN